LASGVVVADDAPAASPETATAAAWAEFNATVAALATRLSLANLHDGESLAVAVAAAIQTEFAAAVSKREAAIDLAWE
jgi:hypothetical protein